MSKPSFEIREDVDNQSGESVHFGHFSRNWKEEEELNHLLESKDAGRITLKQALLRARKLLVTYPDNLEIRHFVSCCLWDMEMRDEAAQMWESTYKLGSSVIPQGFKGQIRWVETDNRSFLRVAKGHLLGLMHDGDGKAAMKIARKLLAWCPGDNQGIRFLVGDISLLMGDTKRALKTFLAEAASSPANWYQAAQIMFREEDFIKACTYVRRGIAANPYIAEGLAGRTTLREHLYWHGSSQYGPDWASDFMDGPARHWVPEEIDFVDWVFNSAAVLRERAELMDLRQGVTYELDPDRRSWYFQRSWDFEGKIGDDISKSMVRKVRNLHGVETWPWDRQGIMGRS